MNQLLKYMETWLQKIDRHHLGFVKNNDTVCYVMQLSAS